jgi:serine/threonine protein kinase
MDQSENSSVRIGNIKNRLFILSPIVSRGLDRECIKTDFVSSQDESIIMGSFGKTLKVSHKTTKVVYCVKVVHKERLVKLSSVDSVNTLLKAMYGVKHPNILRLYNHFEDDDNLFLIFPFVNFKTLFEVMRGRLEENTALRYVKQITEGVEYLHNSGIYNRDFKPENILLDVENEKILLTDYGWADLNQKYESRRTLTLSTYIAPEMFKKGDIKVDHRVDIWNIGVLMFELLTGKSLFAIKNEDELKESVLNLKIRWPDNLEQIPKYLISRILKVNPEERITIKEILNNVLFHNLENTSEVDEDTLQRDSIINFKKSTPIAPTKKDSKSRKDAALLKEYEDKIAQLTAKLDDEVKKTAEKSKECETLKKDYTSMQEKYNKLQKDNNTMKAQKEEQQVSPNNSSMDSSFFKQYPSDNEKIKIEFLKQDRLTAITHLEEKNNEILEYRSHIRLLENDQELIKMNLKELQEKNSEYESEITSLQNRLELEQLEKETKVEFLNQKIENLERKLLTPLKADDLNYTYTLLLADMIKDFKNLVETLIMKSKDGQDKLIQDIKDLLTQRETNIRDIILKSKESIENNYLRKSLNNDNSQRIAGKDKIEWLQKQINELLPFKLKSTKVEEVNAKWEREYKIINDRLRLAEEELVTLRKINEGNKIEKAKLNLRIVNIENKLSDIKDFMMKNCDEEKTEGFMDIYNKYNF